LYALSAQDLDSATAELHALEGTIKTLRGAKSKRPAANRQANLEQAKALLVPRAARLLLAHDGWFDEMNRLVAEAAAALARENRRRQLTGEALRAGKWKEQRGFKLDLPPGDAVAMREPATRDVDGLERISLLAKSLARRNLPAEATLRDAHAFLPDQNPSWADKASECSASVAIWQDAPDFLRITYLIRASEHAPALLCIELFLETRSETPADQLAKGWIAAASNPLQKLGRSLAQHAQKLPWRSVTDLSRAIKEYHGGPTDLLIELGLHRRRLAELFAPPDANFGRTLVTKIPRLIEGSPWAIVQKHLIPLLKALPAQLSNAGDILKSLVKAAASANDSDLLEVDAFLTQALESLRAESPKTILARALVGFFAPWQWNNKLSALVRTLASQAAETSSESLAAKQEEELVEQVKRCLRKATGAGKLPQALAPLGPLLSSRAFSAAVQIAIFDAAAEAVASLRYAQAAAGIVPGSWLAASELNDFVEAVKALRPLNGPWNFESEWDSWSRYLPKLQDVPLRYPAVFADLAAAWLKSPGAPSEWPVFPHIRDVMLWQVETQVSAASGPLSASLGAGGKPKFADLIADPRLSVEDTEQLRGMAVELVCSFCERGTAHVSALVQALIWVCPERSNLLELTKDVAALTPWAEPWFRDHWRRWLVDGWVIGFQQPRSSLLRLVLKAWACAPKNREAWRKVLGAHCPCNEFKKETGTLMYSQVEQAISDADFQPDDLEQDFVIYSLADWAGRRAVCEAASNFGSLMRQVLNCAPEEQLCLRLSSLSAEEFSKALPSFLARHFGATEMALDDPNRRGALLEVLNQRKALGDDSALLDGFLLGRLFSCATKSPMETWERLVSVGTALGPTAEEYLPSLYQQLAPGLLARWMSEKDAAAIGHFADAVGTSLEPIDRSLVGPLAGEFLVKTKAEWSFLKSQAEQIDSTFATCRLDKCYDRELVRAILKGPELPAETGRLLLAAIFCAPAHLARNMMEDLAWQAASAQRTFNKAAAKTLSSLALP
jgi:hypothetical protein